MLPRLLPERVLRSAAIPSSLLLFVFCSATVPAQMSGTFTIDPNGTGTRNFKDFPNAAYQVFVQGVSGPVVFDVAPGTYSKAVNLGPVKGVSSKNTITFKSRTKPGARITATVTILDYSPNFPVRWYVFDGLELAAGGTLLPRSGISASGSCTDLEIRNCKITSCSLVTRSVFLKNDPIQRWKVHHNTFLLGTCFFQSAQGMEIHHNEFDTNNANRLSAIVMTNSSFTFLRSRIYNNVIFSDAIQRGGAVVGIQVAWNADVFHNTIVVDATFFQTGPRSGSRCVFANGVFGRHCNVGNNIMVTRGNDTCATYSTAPFATFSDGNIYLTKNSVLGVVNGKSLSNWQNSSGQGKNSSEKDPQFQGSGKVVTDLRPKPTSPAVGKAVNTPSYITDDFFGNPRGSKPAIGAIEPVSPSTFIPYGMGCAGTGGKVPAIGMSGDLKLGSTNFLVTLSNAKGGSGVSTFFVIGPKTNVSFGGGCTLLVAPLFLIRLPVGGLPGAGNGSSSIKLPLPSDPKFKGVTASCQWGVIDSAAAGIGVAFSNAATIKL